VDIVLLDWTRMGRFYCLAGALVQAGGYRIVRPLPAFVRDRALPQNGWPAHDLDGHSRWEVFEMVRPAPADSPPPHLEDAWVSSLRSRKQLAPAPQRRAILQSTLGPPDKPLFGIDLLRASSAFFVEPGTGARSLASVVVPAEEVHFTALWRDGASEPDYRVRLPLPGLGTPILPVKDHFLLCRAEAQAGDLDARLHFLASAVRQMGRQVLVRLGLSRAISFAGGQPGRCWLLADGFFSLEDPQP
jgi:hypothetical protein